MKNSESARGADKGGSKTLKRAKKGEQFCSSKSSDSYYVESVIEELKNENLTAVSRARLSGFWASGAPYFGY